MIEYQTPPAALTVNPNKFRNVVGGGDNKNNPRNTDNKFFKFPEKKRS